VGFGFCAGFERDVALCASPCTLVLAVDQSHGVSKPKGALTSTIYLTRSGDPRQAKGTLRGREPLAACWPADDTASIPVNDGDASGLRSPMTTWRCAVTGLGHMGEGLVH